MTPETSDYLKRLGRRVRTFRAAAGWSQFGLSERCGLDRSYISLIECGLQNITFEVAASLADAFGVPLQEFLILES